jgi:hypothetical protein
MSFTSFQHEDCQHNTEALSRLLKIMQKKEREGKLD